MENFCPLCEKNGIKRRLKAFQINLEEAMWACEAEECSWPIGYEELTFFPRTATSCTWEEPSPAKEDIPALIELSLYTPPVTPAGELSKELTEIASIEYSSHPPTEDKIVTLPKCEFIALPKESTSSSKSPLFELHELGDINSKESSSRSITNEQLARVRPLPKVINIEKTNINFRIFYNAGEQCDGRKSQEYEHSLTDTTTMDVFKNLEVPDNTCIEFSSNIQDKTRGEQNKSDKSQLDTTVSNVKINFDTKTLSETTKPLGDLGVTNNANTTNESVENISNGDLDTLLEDIFTNGSNIPVDLNDDWLNMLMS